MASDRKSLQEHIDTMIRLLDRRVIFEHEAIAKLLDDVAFGIMQFGSTGQISQLLELIPKLPESVQTELQKFVCGSDDRIFCRNILCDPGENPPEDWRHPPSQQRAEIDYTANPITILIHCSDGSSFDIPPDDQFRNIVFAMREHFDPSFNYTRNA